MNGPDPGAVHPLHGFPNVCFIRNTVKNPQIIVGDYTYYHDPDGAQDFERNVLYLYDFVGDRLRIGNFCAIGRGAKFLMNGATHNMSGFSTYPFPMFGNGWEFVLPKLEELPYKGDTVIGNDVWIGYDALIMPGVTIGDGAIIAARSVVTKNIPPYAIAGGNPAEVVRMRFDEATILELQEIAWWSWSAEKITTHLRAIVSADLPALRRAALPSSALLPSSAETVPVRRRRTRGSGPCP